MSEVIVTAANVCPKCGEYGLFHYVENEIKSHPEEFYQCESCLTSFDNNLKEHDKEKK